MGTSTIVFIIEHQRHHNTYAGAASSQFFDRVGNPLSLCAAASMCCKKASASASAPFFWTAF